MAGKPNLMPGRSLSATSATLDQQRAASMADEGGTAGAEMEAQEYVRESLGEESRLPHPTLEKALAYARAHWQWFVAGAIIGVGSYAFSSRYSRRSEPALQPE